MPEGCSGRDGGIRRQSWPEPLLQVGVILEGFFPVFPVSPVVKAFLFASLVSGKSCARIVTMGLGQAMVSS